MAGLLAPTVKGVESVGQLSLETVRDPYSTLAGDEEIVEIDVTPRLIAWALVFFSVVDEEDGESPTLFSCASESSKLRTEAYQVSSICWCLSLDDDESELGLPTVISQRDSLNDCCIPHPVEEKLCKPVKVFSVVDGDDTLTPLA